MQRGRKPAPSHTAPLVATSIFGLDKERFRHIPNEVWNALSSALRACTLDLLESIETFSRDSRNDPLELIQATVPEWAYRTGIQAMEAVLVDKTGFLGSRLTCDDCGHRTLRLKDYAPHSFKTVLGVVKHKRAYYRCECCGHSAYPMDHQLGLDGEHRMVPRLQEIMARMSAKTSYPDALDTISMLLPVQHCLKLQENVTHTIAAVARAEQEREHREAFSDPAKAKFPSAMLVHEEESEVAAIATDGGFCRMKGKNEDAREFKLGVLGWLHPKPRASPEEEPPEVKARHYTGSFRGCDFAMELTEIEFHRMGLCRAKTIQVIGDGAPWIWNRAGNFRTNDEQELIFTLDLYHARERLSDVANEFFGKSSAAAREWYKARDAELLNDKLPNFFRAFTRLAKEATRRGYLELAQEILENRTYFHKRKHMLNYRECLARGLLVGSGMDYVTPRLQKGEFALLARTDWTAPGWSGRSREPRTYYTSGPSMPVGGGMNSSPHGQRKGSRKSRR